MSVERATHEPRVELAKVFLLCVPRIGRFRRGITVSPRNSPSDKHPKSDIAFTGGSAQAFCVGRLREDPTFHDAGRVVSLSGMSNSGVGAFC